MRLRDWREQEGITQQDAAERLGCSYGAYIKYEYGQRFPRPVTMKQIIAVTNGKVGYDDFHEQQAA